MSCRVVLSPVPTLGGVPRKQAHVPPLDNTAKPTLAASTQTQLVDWIVASPPNDHASPITHPVAPQPRHFNCCQASPTTTAQHPVRGLPRQHAVERKSQATSRAPRMPNQAPSRHFPRPSRRLLFSSSPPSSVILLVPHRALFPLSAVSFSLLIQDCVYHTHAPSPLSPPCLPHGPNHCPPFELSDEPKQRPNPNSPTAHLSPISQTPPLLAMPAVKRPAIPSQKPL